MENNDERKPDNLSKKELKEKLKIKSDQTIHSYIGSGVLPQPVKQEEDGEMLFDKKEILRLLGAKSFDEEFISPEQAAKILGVNKNDISSYAGKGLIPHYRLKNVKGTKNLYLRSEMEAAKEYTVSWSSHFANRLGKEKLFSEILGFLLNHNAALLTVRETQILRLVLVENKSFIQIGNETDLSPNRVKDIFRAAVRRLSSQIKKITEQIEKIQDIVQERDLLREKIKFFEKEESKYEKFSFEARKNLKLKISECTISARVKNALEGGDIKTIADLARLKRKEFFRLRNAGEKSAKELDQLLEKLGLSWEMEI